MAGGMLGPCANDKFAEARQRHAIDLEPEPEVSWRDFACHDIPSLLSVEART